MRVLVSASAHFAVDPDGELWAGNASLDHSFWARYLEVYEEVLLLVRARPVQKPPAAWCRATGPGVKAMPLPDFRSVRSAARHALACLNTIRRALTTVEAVHLRLPCMHGSIASRVLATGRPYGVEVVGDPYDSLAPGAVRHPLRPFFRGWLSAELKRNCRKAAGVAYVTEHALQRRYRAGPGAYVTHYSNVRLSEVAISPTPRVPRVRPGAPFVLVSVGTLAQLYKAPDVLIEAVASCVREGIDLRLVVIGDGKYRPVLEARSSALGLDGRVRFLGQLPAGDAIREHLDAADLFVLPSRQEGLPRAMIEAMARGLPCIGSTVGGIPELLPPEDLVPPGDVDALARKIREVLTDRQRMARMSARNLVKAGEYREESLRERRIAFYRYVRKKTEEWLAARAQ